MPSQDPESDRDPPPNTLPWLAWIVRRLLAPDGCPWDRQQTLPNLRAYLLEECYEVIESIDEGDRAHHCEELGDLLFQIVFQAQLAGTPLTEVIRGIGDKLVRRHPHVFGDVVVDNAEQVKANWEKLKAAERNAAAASAARPSALDGVPRALPALQRGRLLVTRAARAGFDWPTPAAARAKVSEELAEVDQAARLASTGGDPGAVAREIGDLLLALVAWARKLDVDPEAALRDAGSRFDARFRALEATLAAGGRSVDACDLSELAAVWRAVKPPGDQRP